jgi:hypothetical protein
MYPTKGNARVVISRSMASCGTLPIEMDGRIRVEALNSGVGLDGGEG